MESSITYSKQRRRRGTSLRLAVVDIAEWRRPQSYDDMRIQHPYSTTSFTRNQHNFRYITGAKWVCKGCWTGRVVQDTLP